MLQSGGGARDRAASGRVRVSSSKAGRRHVICSVNHKVALSCGRRHVRTNGCADEMAVQTGSTQGPCVHGEGQQPLAQPGGSAGEG